MARLQHAKPAEEYAVPGSTGKHPLFLVLLRAGWYEADLEFYGFEATALLPCKTSGTCLRLAWPLPNMVSVSQLIIQIGPL